MFSLAQFPALPWVQPTFLSEEGGGGGGGGVDDRRLIFPNSGW